MLETNLRDVKIKCRKFRNAGLSTGTVKRLNGDIIPISLKTCKLDQYIGRYGLKEPLEIKLESEVINVRIRQIHRHYILHNAINVDFFEIE